MGGERRREEGGGGERDREHRERKRFE